MKKIKRYGRLYYLFARYSLIRAMMYREEFMVWSLVSLGWLVLNLVFFQLLYGRVTEVAGWTKPEMLVLLGFYFVFNFVMWGVFWENMLEIPEKINRGTMDLELLKPVNHQFLLSLKKLGMDNFQDLFVGIGLLVYADRIGEFEASWGSISLSLLMVLVASVFVYAVWFSTMCFAFWADRIDNLQFLFPGARDFWRLPHNFYKGLLKGILTFVMPVTLVTTVPSLVLLGQPDYKLAATLVVFAGLALWFSRWFFKFALKRYSSASS